MCSVLIMFFFFKQKTAYEMRISDWSSDVCSSDLPDLRFPLPENFAARLVGRRVERIQRRAKYMLLHLDDGQVLLCHLGMSGRMVIVKRARGGRRPPLDRHDHIVFVTEARSEEHTSELQSLMRISYAVFCLKKKKI